MFLNTHATNAASKLLPGAQMLGEGCGGVTPQQIKESNSQGNCVSCGAMMMSKSRVAHKFQCTFHLGLSFHRRTSVRFCFYRCTTGIRHQIEGLCSILTSRFQVRGSVFLQSTEINDDTSVLPCNKRALPDVLEGVVLNFFLEQTLFFWSIFLPLLFGGSCRSFLSHPMTWYS